MNFDLRVREIITDIVNSKTEKRGKEERRK